MPTETVTTRFCAAMLDAARSGLPREAGAAARRTLLNVLGTAISAAGSGAVRTLLGGGGEGDGAGVVLAKGNDQPSRATPYWIALATGTAAHLDDFDDTHLATVIHPGASALATVLAIGREAGGAAFLGAFAAGCEAQLRIGNAISPAHYDHGWHITGTCGVFGAAIEASALFGLDAEAAARAMSLAAVMTVGHREAFGSMTKPLHAGKAAANGILAAWLAGRGLSGPADPLGAGGVLEVLAGGPGHVDRSALDLASRDGASRGWELEVNTFKTYPCGVVAHPAMDVAVDAFGLIGESPAITGASVTCNPLVLELMGLAHPRDGLQARFSARHGIACGLRYGRAGLAEFSDEVARDPEVTRLRDLIELVPDASCARDAAVLRVSAAGREPVEVAVEHTRGSMDRPLTDVELLAKVEELVSPVLGAGAAAAIRDMVNALPGSPDVDGLLAATGLAESALAGPALAGGTAAGGTAAGGTAAGGTAAGGTAAGETAAGPALGAAAPTTLNTSESDGSSTPSDPAASPVTDAAPTTDVILALALTEPPLVDRVLVADQADGEAKTSLAVFAEAVTAGEASTVAQAVRAAGGAGMLPEGHAWTAFTSAAAAVSSAAASAASAGGHALPVETVIVCAAATALGEAAAMALGEDCAEAEAVAIGCDVADLVASGLPDAAGQGWSAPVIAALIGATVAAGLMLGLAEHQLRAAIGIAATQAAGLASAEGTDAWTLQAGKAAFNAVEAAQFAQAGFTSSSHPLEGRRGLYALFAS